MGWGGGGGGQDEGHHRHPHQVVAKVLVGKDRTSLSWVTEPWGKEGGGRLRIRVTEQTSDLVDSRCLDHDCVMSPLALRLRYGLMFAGGKDDGPIWKTRTVSH